MAEPGRRGPGGVFSTDGGALPYVSVVIPMRNEEAYIGACLDALLAGDYPAERYEILAVDGDSGDDTVAAVKRRANAARASGGPAIRVLSNPRGITPVSLNMGIREAQGEIVVRMDAHTEPAPDYVRQCVAALGRTNAWNVGGVQRAVGHDARTWGIALATSSPFAAGDAKFRYADREAWVDTVYLGAWRKATLDALGGFNEAWVVNQDDELNVRLRAAGGRILLAPTIRCVYHVRGTLRKLARQYFRYGRGRVRTQRAHRGSLRWRQFVAPAFVLALAASAGLLVAGLWPGGQGVWPWLGLVVPAAYVLGLAAATVVALRGWRRGRAGLSWDAPASLAGAGSGGSRPSAWRVLPWIPAAFVVVHVCWGVGWWVGALGRA